jgi:peptide/nickel transport system substrate-binding protein
MFDGALPAKEAVKQDLTKAKQALAASGHSGDSVTLGYPSDLTINGVPFATLAQRVQSNLQAVGINVQLSGSPTGTWLTDYRSGKMAFGLSLWGPDYPDPADYLTFAPGDLVGLRVGWTKGASPAIEKTAAAAAVATDTKQRTTLFQKFQRQLNATGPYFPLMQPTQVFVATSDLKNAVYNAVYSVDVTKLAPK